MVNDQLYNCPIHNGNGKQQMCLSKCTLSKTTASCLGYYKVLGTNIFLCIYPCFRLFHLNPKLYLKEGMYYQIVCGYDQYDQDQEDELVNQQFLISYSNQMLENQIPYMPNHTRISRI